MGYLCPFECVCARACVRVHVLSPLCLATARRRAGNPLGVESSRTLRGHLLVCFMAFVPDLRPPTDTLCDNRRTASAAATHQAPLAVPGSP
eukprot:3758431-Amphidinium_carterae.1